MTAPCHMTQQLHATCNNICMSHNNSFSRYTSHDTKRSVSHDRSPYLLHDIRLLFRQGSVEVGGSVTYEVLLHHLVDQLLHLSQLGAQVSVKRAKQVLFESVSFFSIYTAFICCFPDSKSFQYQMSTVYNQFITTINNNFDAGRLELPATVMGQVQNNCIQGYPHEAFY